MPLIKYWFCPNEECDNKETVKKGKTCPECGANSKSFGLTTFGAHLNKKTKRSSGSVTADIDVLLSSETSDEDLETKIKQLVKFSNISLRGEFVDSITSIFTGSASDMAIIRRQSVLSFQNKVIICQNELILRKLRKQRVL